MELAATFFYISVGLSVWIIVGALVIVLREVQLTIRSMREVVSDVKHSVADLELLKKGIKVGVLTLVSNVIGGKYAKGGDKDEPTE